MKKILLILGGAIVLIVVVLFSLRIYTKSHSPAETVSYKDDFSITYSRPYKKGRDIFGGLQPHGVVWRTGANEATIFKVNKTIRFGDKVIEPGLYSLFTIPNPQEWSVILNSKTGQWGVNMDQKANRDPNFDVAQITVPSIKSDKIIEQFTILFEEVHEDVEMVLMWDRTVVAIPISIQ